MEKVLKKILQAKGVLVVGHISPDGDSLGSTLGLFHLLRQQGLVAYAMCLDKVPNKYLYLPGSDELLTSSENFPDVNTIVLLDCGDLQRAGLPANIPVDFIVNIDHHSSNSGCFGTAWVDSAFAAVGQQILRLAELARWEISPTVATCLYTSLATDTGFFRHSNTTPVVFRDAALLMELGASTQTVVENAAERKSLGELCLIQQALANLTQECDGRVTIIEVPRSVYAACGVDLDEAEGMIEYAKAVPGTVLAVLLREVSAHVTRVSLRARGDLDVSKVAVSFGGGGHKLAAGCTINAPLPDARRALLDQLIKVLPHA
ncbi:MAG: bifunctional oligoribonuclease/PAP phosphatase NrnA [Peptococcaceae bacterium]|nr:bifunctional oligoribonuclease/PAP phosphatase NrnA [Peptococcaceae bacterium]